MLLLTKSIPLQLEEDTHVISERFETFLSEFVIEDRSDFQLIAPKRLTRQGRCLSPRLFRTLIEVRLIWKEKEADI